MYVILRISNYLFVLQLVFDEMRVVGLGYLAACLATAPCPRVDRGYLVGPPTPSEGHLTTEILDRGTNYIPNF